MLARVIERLRPAHVDEIVVATTVNGADDPVVALAYTEGAKVFRGSERDVLGRYVAAARAHCADVVVRVTADCPLIDAGVLDRAVEAVERRWQSLGESRWNDYASNTIVRTYPRGLDAEALHIDVLERVARIAESPEAREHVTWYINEEAPALFARQCIVDDAHDNSDLRWTVDIAQDLARVRALYAAGGGELAYPELLALARSLEPRNA